jgi:lipoprotein-releasing system permease protein
MYKLLLCWRYLRTRFLAFICIGSVMLGVATLIVVNSVMSGFSTKLKDRLHGLLSDVVIETGNHHGFTLPNREILRLIDSSRIAPYIEARTPTIEAFAMLSFETKHGQRVMRAVNLVGVDPVGRTAIGGFADYLSQPERKAKPNFDMTDDAWFRWQALNPPPREHLPVQPIRNGDFIPPPALESKKFDLELPPPPPALQELEKRQPPELIQLAPAGPPPPDPTPKSERKPKCAILGWAIGSFRDKDPVTGEMMDIHEIEPGDTVYLVTVGVGKETPEPVYSAFAVCDFFRSEMAEYDSHMVFVPLDYLQALRGMDDRATQIQIKLKDYSKAKEVTDELKRLFPPRHGFEVRTWEEKQGALISAIDVERGILNLLLFMIIGVAGFGILAIFSMIVVEKTRDIGILKSLGASNRGVMAIFLSYGLLLGCVGSLLGTLLGLGITYNINEIEHFITKLTGSEIFDRSIYYFSEIPTNVQPISVVLVNVGSILIAVLFSVLPALRAAMLHPVRALRFE